jgi:exopolyphosphatase/guanosine-5'-triphosphate,3'-diphosphate pyrophosphatase
MTAGDEQVTMNQAPTSQATTKPVTVSQSMVSRVAAVDCGTNSIRLLVADVDPVAGTLTDLDRRLEIVRLGQGVDETGRFSAAALDRTFAALTVYAQRIRELGATRVRMVATSATRDAANRADFVTGVERMLGVSPEVVSGDEEAVLSFSGVARELAAAGGAEPYLVVDIGGGSTEFVLGPAAGVQVARSVDIGCVRMTERHFRGAHPPTPGQLAAARADIDASIDLAARTVPLDRTRTLAGLAGTVTTVAGIALGLPAYDSAQIHLSRVTADKVREVAGQLLAMTHDERAAIPVMHPGRVDVIGAGALILAAIVDRLPVGEVVVSEHDILDGIAWSLA